MSAPQTTMVGFCCQSCKAPMKLGQAFSSVTSQRKEMLARELSAVSAPAEPQVNEKDKDKTTLVENPTERPSFETEDETNAQASSSHQAQPQGSKEQKNQAAIALFDFLSSRSDLDHPLCETCTDSLLDQLDDELQRAHAEKQQYESLWKELSSVKVTTSVEAIEAEIKDLEDQEKQVLAEIEEEQRQRGEVEKEKEAYDRELAVLEEEEDKYWREYNDYQRQLMEFEERQESIEHKYKQASEHLEVLKKTNVFNDTFHIWYDSHFGTINGFRLGRLPSVPVSWGEINAAWGHTVLLLYIMAQRLDFKFEGYVLVPNGSSSRVDNLREATREKRELPLFGSGSRLFVDAKFDAGMTAFLDCLRQFKDRVDALDPHFKLPYTIEPEGIISDAKTRLSICMHGSTEENWTKALKFMLTNLKWCLAWMCKQMAS